MTRIPRAAISWMLCISILTICSCGGNSGEIVRLRQRIVADSIHYAKSLDSLSRMDFKARLGDKYQQYGIRAPEKTIDEAYRVYAEFSWGVSPVGPIFSVLAEKSGPRHSMQIYTWPNGKRAESTKEISADDFNRISRAFDSLGFADQPRFINVDYTRYDASRYVIESFKGGTHHAISRSDTVELFVFDLMADFASIGDVNEDLVKQFRHQAKKK